MPCNHPLLEGSMDAAGQRMAAQLQHSGVPVTVVVDAAMGVAVERCDMVLCGAEGVVESGGVLSAVGVFTLAMVAKAMGKPFYVAAESYKVRALLPHPPCTEGRPCRGWAKGVWPAEMLRRCGWAMGKGLIAWTRTAGRSTREKERREGRGGRGGGKGGGKGGRGGRGGSKEG
ncbi:unnamed protein product [Closterium sp. NIES-54]